MTLRATVLTLLWLGAGACRDWDRFEPDGSTNGGAPGTGGAPSNGGGGAGPSTGGSAPQGGEGPWFDDGLASRRPIDIVRPSSEETLSDFPILLRLGADLSVTGDLRLAADDHQTPLPFEVERLLPDGESLVWVRVPSVGPDSTRVWLYYGGTAISPVMLASETWSNGFVAVWHFEDSADDSVGMHGGTVTGATSSVASVGNGFGFDGDGDHVDVAGAVAFDTLFQNGGTISALVRPDSGGEMDRGRIVDRTSNAQFAGGWSLTVGDFVQPESFGFAYSFTGGFAWWLSPLGSTPHGTWHHIAATFAEGDMAPALYVEGEPQRLTVDTDITGAPDIAAGLATRVGGRALGDDRDYAGVIDELRASATVRSQTWLATEAENMAGGLVSVGDAQQQTRSRQ